MAFSIKDWRNNPDTSTPINAGALEDIEYRLAVYTESIGAGGIELGYAEITTDATSQTNYPSKGDVTGLTTTVTVGTRPILVRFFGRVFNTTAGDRCLIYVQEGTTVLVEAAPISTAANQPNELNISRRLAPSAGAHTYKIQMSRLSAGTATIDPSPAAFIQVTEL